MTAQLKLPRQREITCDKCKQTFKSSLLAVAYCPYCGHPNKLEAGFSPNQ
jgi:Zn finger protein HypA/HybF involved in hydrogenase expression